MKPTYQSDDGRVTLYCGDCPQILPTLAERSVQCVVTSPPYFALRSYLPAGHPDKPQEIGSEPSPAAFIATMVAVFAQVRRVLRDDGLLFLNLGDSYGRGTRPGWSGDAKRDQHGLQSQICYDGNYGKATPGPVLDDGQLQNLPHRVAEALRADGWIWRQTICWAKRSPMPESVGGWRWRRCRVMVGVTEHAGSYDVVSGGKGNVSVRQDCPGCPKCEPNGGYVLRRGAGRCTTAHEYIFIMAKKGGYFWDGEACKEEGTYPAGTKAAKGSVERGAAANGRPAEYATYTGQRNPRSVWILSGEPTSVRHFATYPSELVRRCLIAGGAINGVCPKCRDPFAPVVDTPEVPSELRNRCGAKSVLAYRPTCRCGIDAPARPIILDPFSGIGTTAQTAFALNCDAIGIDLNPVYVAEATKRVCQPPRWLIRRQAKERRQAGPAFPGLPAGSGLFGGSK